MESAAVNDGAALVSFQVIVSSAGDQMAPSSPPNDIDGAGGGRGVEETGTSQGESSVLVEASPPVEEDALCNLYDLGWELPSFSSAGSSREDLGFTIGLLNGSRSSGIGADSVRCVGESNEMGGNTPILDAIGWWSS